MYGETPDMSGGFGQEGVDAFEKFLEAGGTLITTLSAVRFPIEFGFAQIGRHRSGRRASTRRSRSCRRRS